MVVSFDIYEVLGEVELIVILIYGVFVFFKRKETFNKVIRLITSSTLFIILLFQLTMEIQMDKSYGTTIFLIIIWFVNALMVMYELGSEN